MIYQVNILPRPNVRLRPAHSPDTVALTGLIALVILILMIVGFMLATPARAETWQQMQHDQSQWLQQQQLTDQLRGGQMQQQMQQWDQRAQQDTWNMQQQANQARQQYQNEQRYYQPQQQLREMQQRDTFTPSWQRR